VKGRLSALLCALLLPLLPAQAAASEQERELVDEKPVVEEQQEETVGRYVYWDDGLQLTGRKSRWDLKVGGKMNYDLGYSDAGEEIEEAFPDFEGFHSDFRRLSVSFFGHLINVFEFKLEIDFANVKDIKDNWVRIMKGPVLPYFTIGNVDEPFSMNNLESSSYMTFMEPALPTSAFSPGRNIGVTANGSTFVERMTLAGGIFLNTGSFSTVGEATDQIENANGLDLTGRLTWLPRYDEEDRELVHLGLSFSHRVRDAEEDDPSADFRSRPESRLTDDYLVETGSFLNRRQEVAGIEAAWRNGPLSLQGEYFHVFVDADENVAFNGWYVSGSWVLTGESRAYSRSGGLFAGIRPQRTFQPAKGGWGALELAARYSAVDLNDKSIRGGKERNVTLGLNWYLKRKVRLMINYIHARVKDRLDPTIEDSRADILMSRFQVSF